MLSRHAGPLPGDGVALAAMLPDEPRWVETRSLLRSGDAMVVLSADTSSAVVLDPDVPAGYLVGPADAALLHATLADVPEDFELVVQADAIDAARRVLAEWRIAPATSFSPSTAWRPVPATDRVVDAVVVSVPPAAEWVARVPDYDEMRFYAGLAEAIAVRLVDDEVVAVCAAGDVTEAWWDVGIDTIETHRRAGHGTAAFRALATHLASTGHQPVWCAEDENEASTAMAARLGFEPVSRLAIFRP
jgi:RimJ/RimL family protein N-acetyltransferase